MSSKEGASPTTLVSSIGFTLMSTYNNGGKMPGNISTYYPIEGSRQGNAYRIFVAQII
jgi:hypothetical protein